MDSSFSSPSLNLLQFPSSLIILSFLLISLTLFKYWFNYKNQYCKLNFPPGPKPSPVIGNLHQLIGPGLPHHAITKLCRKYGAVVTLRLGEVFSVVVSSPEAAKQFLKTNEISFAQRPDVYANEVMGYDHSSIVFSPYNDYWRQLRKISVLKLLSTKRVQSFRNIREEEVWNLVDYIRLNEGRIINLSDNIYNMANNVISKAAFGRKCKDQHDFSSLLGETITLVTGFNLADLFPSVKFLRYITGMKSALFKIHKKIDKILEDIVTEHMIKRKGNNGRKSSKDDEDLVDTLLTYVEATNNFDFQLTLDQVKAVTMDIYSAGSETSATSMEWAMSELLKNPKVMAKAQEEVREAFQGKNKIDETDVQKLDYLRSIVKETFRIHPPLPLVPREAREKCEINGYAIPAKTKIIINVYAIGRDPNIWIDPENFRPERFENSSIDFKGNNFELLPFGGGRRICPGISFATANIELGLAQLLYHFDWKLPNDARLEDLDMSGKFGMTVKRKNKLQVIATTRIPFQT